MHESSPELASGVLLHEASEMMIKIRKKWPVTKYSGKL